MHHDQWTATCPVCKDTFTDDGDGRSIADVLHHVRLMHPGTDLTITREAREALDRATERQRRHYLACGWCDERFVLHADSFFDIRGHQRIAHRDELTAAGIADDLVVVRDGMDEA